MARSCSTSVTTARTGWCRWSCPIGCSRRSSTRGRSCAGARTSRRACWAPPCSGQTASLSPGRRQSSLRRPPDVPIVTLQRQMREIGRIRTGETVVTNGKRRPAKLATFRLTSRSEDVIRAAAAVYGGVARPWGDQWEVITDTDRLDIVLRPGQPIDQWDELWAGGGCVRRGNGEGDILADAPCGSAPSVIDGPNGSKRTIPACPQDASERRDVAAAGMACKPTTRLSVILPSIPDLGAWRLESHGYYAAVELAGTVDVLAEAERLLPAGLRLDQRGGKG